MIEQQVDCWIIPKRVGDVNSMHSEYEPDDDDHDLAGLEITHRLALD